jgi:glutathione S-transferase
MADIEKSMRIEAPLPDVWAALTEPEAIMGWMGDDSQVAVDLREGGRYQFFFGATTGTVTHLDPPHALAYTWRQEEWPSDWPDSIVTWQLQPDGDATQVHLTHTTFPNAAERDGHDQGWDLYWLNPMKDWLEAHAE